MNLTFFRLKISLFLAILLAWANLEAGALSLVVKPPNLDLISNPGAAKSFFLVVNNPNPKESIEVKIYLETAYMDQEGELVFLTVDEAPEGAGNWIKLRKDKVKLKPLASEKIPLRLNMPAGIASGGYYAAVMFEPVGKDESIQKGLQVAFRLASLVQITVKGSKPLVRKAEFGDLSYFYGPLNIKDLSQQEVKTVKAKVAKEFPDKKGTFFAVQVKNIGNTHFRAKGTVLITTKDNKRKGEVELVSGKGMVYPGGARFFIGQLPTVLSAGDYLAQLRFRYDSGGRLIKEYPFSIKVAQGSRSSQGEDLSSLEIIPKKIDLEIISGSLRTQKYSLINHLEDSLNLTVTTSGELSNWIEIVDGGFSLPPDRDKNFAFRVTVPETAEEGSYSGVIIFEDKTKGVEESLPITLKVKRRF